MLRETSAANTIATSTACAARASWGAGAIPATVRKTKVAERARANRTSRITVPCKSEEEAKTIRSSEQMNIGEGRRQDVGMAGSLAAAWARPPSNEPPAPAKPGVARHR